METVLLYQFLTEVPRAAAIWSALLLLALAGLTALVARPEPDDPADERPEPADDPASTAAVDLRRYAGEVAVAAAGATQTARRRRAAWLAAQEEVDRAWQAYERAEVAARRLSAAAALPSPQTPRTPAEYAGRERWLHQAAMAAHWRGELSARQLSDVFGQRAGWDPRRHPVEQEIVLARAARDHRFAEYRVAAARERSAWRSADLAARGSQALSAEAYAAAERVRPGRLPAVRASSVRLPLAAARWRPARAG